MFLFSTMTPMFCIGSGLRPLESLRSFRKNPRRWTLKWQRKKNSAKHCRTTQLRGWCLLLHFPKRWRWLMPDAGMYNPSNRMTHLTGRWLDRRGMISYVWVGCWATGLVQIQRILWLQLLGSKCWVVRHDNIHTLCCVPSTSSLARSVFGDPLVERHHI